MGWKAGLGTRTAGLRGHTAGPAGKPSSCQLCSAEASEVRELLCGDKAVAFTPSLTIITHALWTSPAVTQLYSPLLGGGYWAILSVQISIFTGF